MTKELEVVSISIGQLKKFLEKAQSKGYSEDDFVQVLWNEYPILRVVNSIPQHNSYVKEFIQKSLITWEE